jgi:hypothetical protein
MARDNATSRTSVDARASFVMLSERTGQGREHRHRRGTGGAEHRQLRRDAPAIEMGQEMVELPTRSRRDRRRATRP